MPVITIASPDKLSISAFISFMRFCLGKEYKIGTLQSLQTKEDVEKYVETMVSSTDKVLFSYYAKRKINIDPVQVIPQKLMGMSDMVVWMDMFSVEWKILKDKSNQASSYLDRWKKNIEKMNVDPI